MPKSGSVPAVDELAEQLQHQLLLLMKYASLRDRLPEMKLGFFEPLVSGYYTEAHDKAEAEVHRLTEAINRAVAGDASNAVQEPALPPEEFATLLDAQAKLADLFRAARAAGLPEDHPELLMLHAMDTACTELLLQGYTDVDLSR